MMKISRRAVVILLTGLSCVIIAGCGKKKELDAASSKVLPITVAAPSNTPTPSVEQVDSAAVTTNGNLTMVNEYLADQSTSGAADSTDTSAADSSTDNNSDDNTDSSDAGTGESDGSEEQ